MRYFEHVIAGLAMAPVDRDVLRYARLVAGLGEGGTRVTFVHVLPPADAWMHGHAPSPTLASARAALQDSIAETFGPMDDHRLLVTSGHHVDALLQQVGETGADLVLVGHRKDARGRRSFSRRLATKAPCSVWMVPEGSPAHITRIIAAVDFSLPSALALSLATLIASRVRALACTALHVQAPSAVGFDEIDRAEAERTLDRFLSPIDLHDVTVQRRIEESGSVAGVVNAMVRDERHDLVVVGTRGRSPSAAVLLGSESEHVLTESAVPVLVTKEPGERIGVLKALLDRDFRAPREPRFG